MTDAKENAGTYVSWTTVYFMMIGSIIAFAILYIVMFPQILKLTGSGNDELAEINDSLLRARYELTLIHDSLVNIESGLEAFANSLDEISDSVGTTPPSPVPF